CARSHNVDIVVDGVIEMNAVSAIEFGPCGQHVRLVSLHERAVFTFKQGRMACFVGVMRGEIFPDGCNQCLPSVSVAFDLDLDLDRDRLRHRYRAPKSISRRDRGGAGGRGLLKGNAWGSSSATLPRVCEWA